MDSPDELPLSQGEASTSHSELPLGEDVSGGVGSGIGEAPLALEPSLEVMPLPPQPAPQPAALQESSEDEARGEEIAIRLRPPPPKKRRGRPRKTQQTQPLAKQRASAEDAQPPGGSCSTLVPSRSSVRALTATEASALEKQASFPLAVMRTLSQGPCISQGYAVWPQELGSGLVAAMALGQGRPAEVSAATRRVAGEMLSGEVWSLSTTKGMAQRLEQDPKRISTETQRLAAFLFLHQRWRQRALDEALLSRRPRSALVGYFDFAAHDETPLHVRISGDLGEGHAPPRAHVELDSPPSEARSAPSGVVCHLGNAGILSSKSSSSQKLVQTVAATATLFHFLGAPMGVMSRTLCPIGVVSRTTIASLRGLQFRVSPASNAAKLFTLQHRVGCTDAHPSNSQCEAGVAATRGPPEQSVNVHRFCDIHRLSGCHEKVFGLVDADVRGMIHAALSLRNGSAMQRFRLCLRNEVRSRLDILVGRPPQDAIEYKTRALRLFVTHGASVATRRILLVLCPNGDWREERAQFYRNLGRVEINSDADAVTHVTNSLLVALCGSQPSVYHRRRWTGADLACDELGIFECCHRLLSTTYLRFAASFVSGALRRQLLACVELAAKQDGSGVRLQLCDSLAAEGEVEDPAMRVGDAVGGEDAIGAQGAGVGASAGQMETDWAKQNAKSRNLAVKFVLSQPLGRLVLMRNVLEPLRQYMSKQFFRAGVDFEKAQRAKLIEALSRGESGAGLRSYRVSEVAGGEDDRRFFSSK